MIRNTPEGYLVFYSEPARAVETERRDRRVESAGVITFLLLGRYLEEKSKKWAGPALHALLDLGAKDVTGVRESPADPGNLMAATRTEQSIPIEDLTVGDLFVVRPGEKVATDGIVVDGQAAARQRPGSGPAVPWRPVSPLWWPH